MRFADQRNAFLVPLAFLLVLSIGAGFLGCSASPDEGKPDPGDTTTVEIGRGTIDSLLSVYFPEKYSNRDSLDYEEMLDDRYSFQKLPDDPDQPVEELFWDKTEELKIAGRMFRGTLNVFNQSVESISLTMNVGSTTPSFDTDQPDDEDWFDVVSIVDMTVVLNDPNQPDGTGILNLLIDSEQKFIVTEDKDSPGDWVVVKQEDQQRIGKNGAEETTWSDFKGMFR